MAGEWREYRLGEIADIVGGSTPSTADPSNFNGDIPWLTPKDLSGSHDRYVSRGERNLSSKGLESCSAQLLPAGTVLLTSRAPIGYVAIAKNPMATNQGFRNLVPKPGFSSEFLYYWLKVHVDELQRHASGSTFQELSGSALAQIKIRVPPLPEQRAIAHILGTLDDKIELNRRMSETLEQMARALFKAWFVDFEPVRAKMEGRWRRGESLPGLPAHLYDIFPDRLVESELGEIPEGWRVGSFGNFISQRLERVGQREVVVLSAVASGRLVRSDEHFTKRVYSKETENYLLVEQWDFAYNPSRINIGSIGMLEERLLGAVSPVYVVVRSEPAYRWFLAFSLRRSHTKMWINTLASGSVRQSLSYADFASIPCVVPPEAVVQEFNQRWSTLRDRIHSYEAESRTLAALRDALLPKLIQGEIRVKDAERFLKERGL